MELLVGTYSHSLAGMAGNGEGIYGVSFEPEDGTFGAPRLLARCVNPSSLTQAPDGQTVFAGREVFACDGPALLSFNAGPDLTLTPRAELPLTGELPCHLSYDPIHARLASAQYWTGDVAISSVAEGLIAGPATCLAHQGSGPNVERQEGPHAHFVTFTDQGTVLHSVDLGADLIVSHLLNAANQSVQTVSLALPPGSGPRHMAVTRDGQRAFVLCELDESLVVLTRRKLGWSIATIQPGFAAPSGEDGAGAAIRLSADERHLSLWPSAICHRVFRCRRRPGHFHPAGRNRRPYAAGLHSHGGRPVGYCRQSA